MTTLTCYSVKDPSLYQPVQRLCVPEVGWLQSRYLETVLLRSLCRWNRVRRESTTIVFVFWGSTGRSRWQTNLGPVRVFLTQHPCPSALFLGTHATLSVTAHLRHSPSCTVSPKILPNLYPYVPEEYILLVTCPFGAGLFVPEVTPTPFFHHPLPFPPVKTPTGTRSVPSTEETLVHLRNDFLLLFRISCSFLRDV